MNLERVGFFITIANGLLAPLLPSIACLLKYDTVNIHDKIKFVYGFLYIENNQYIDIFIYLLRWVYMGIHYLCLSSVHWLSRIFIIVWYDMYLFWYYELYILCCINDFLKTSLDNISWKEWIETFLLCLLFALREYCINNAVCQP